MRRPERHHCRSYLADGSGGALDRGTGCPAFYAYSTNYLVDVQAGIIVDVEATLPSGLTRSLPGSMIERIEDRLDLKPDA